MLQEGFHLAFCELFNLIDQQKDAPQQDSLDASENKTIPLEDDPEKLNMLKENLIAAETAKRRGVYPVSMCLEFNKDINILRWKPFQLFF